MQLWSRGAEWIFWWGASPHPDVFWVYRFLRLVSGWFNDIHTPLSFPICKQKFQNIQYLMHSNKNICVPLLFFKIFRCPYLAASYFWRPPVFWKQIVLDTTLIILQKETSEDLYYCCSIWTQNIYIYIYIYLQARISSFPRLINVARVNE